VSWRLPLPSWNDALRLSLKKSILAYWEQSGMKTSDNHQWLDVKETILSLPMQMTLQHELVHETSQLQTLQEMRNVLFIPWGLRVICSTDS
jgi:hypothetical protein